MKVHQFMYHCFELVLHLLLNSAPPGIQLTLVRVMASIRRGDVNSWYKSCTTKIGSLIIVFIKHL